MSITGSYSVDVSRGRFLVRTGWDLRVPPGFWQLLHLQYWEQGTPAWKHSQYFLRQPDLRQLHPFCLARLPFSVVTIPSALPRKKALLFLSNVDLTARSRSAAWWAVLWQSWQLQLVPHCAFLAKHSQ